MVEFGRKVTKKVINLPKADYFHVAFSTDNNFETFSQKNFSTKCQENNRLKDKILLSAASVKDG
jgi:hypothetical protein